MDLTELEDSEYKRLLVYGPPKSGKSRLVGMLAERYNLVWFDLENGRKVLRSLPIEWQKRIQIIPIPDTKSYPIAIETVRKVIKGSAYEICLDHGKCFCPICKTNERPFSFVELNALDKNSIAVFDSATQLTSSAIAQILRNQPEEYKPGWDDWGNLGRLMDAVLSEVQQSQFHCIFISHETDAERVDKTTKIVPVSGTRNFSRNVAKYFDDVVYCDVKNKKHIAASSSVYNNTIQTGSRSGISIEDFEIPTLIPFFTGEIPTQKKVHEAVTAAKSSSKLSNLLAKTRANNG